MERGEMMKNKILNFSGEAFKYLVLILLILIGISRANAVISTVRLVPDQKVKIDGATNPIPTYFESPQEIIGTVGISGSANNVEIEGGYLTDIINPIHLYAGEAYNNPLFTLTADSRYASYLGIDITSQTVVYPVVAMPFWGNTRMKVTCAYSGITNGTQPPCFQFLAYDGDTSHAVRARNNHCYQGYIPASGTFIAGMHEFEMELENLTSGQVVSATWSTLNNKGFSTNTGNFMCRAANYYIYNGF